MAKMNLLLAREEPSAILDRLSALQTLRPIRKRSSLFWILLTSCLALGSTSLGFWFYLSQRQKPPVYPAPKVIYGYLLRPGDMQPLSDAWIILRSRNSKEQQSATMQSDSRGFFILEGTQPIEPDDRIQIRRQGCIDEWLSIHPDRAVTVDPFGRRIPADQWPTLIYEVRCHAVR